MLSPDILYPLEKVTKAVLFLKNFITNPNIQVGDYTYYDGRDHGEKFETENVIFARSCRLIIGKFCQIAYGTKFLLSDANHQMSGFSTFHPAKTIRKRFSDEIIEQLIKIEWWNWDYEKITRNIPAIVGADIEMLLRAK